MRFDQMLAGRTHASQPREPVEYPKYINIAGKQVLALDAEHEAELLGISDSLEEPAGDEINVAGNLLSAPEKRKGGWPPGKPRKPAVISTDKD